MSVPLGRLQFIRGAKRPRPRLDAIAELLEPRAQGHARASARWTCLRSRRAGIDAEMARQAGLRGQLMPMPAAIRGPDGTRPLPASARCPAGGINMHIMASGSPPPLPGFLNSLAGPLNSFGYWAVLLFVMLEDFGIPLPGETVLIAASVYAGAGRLNVIAVGIIGFVAAVIGDNIGFAIGHYGGRALVLRWGRYVHLTEERLDKAEAFFDHNGAWIITVARFIEGLRQANGIIAGITGMRWLRFLVFNALGAALWVGTWVSLGYLAGSHIDAIYHDITKYSTYLLIAVAVLLAGYIARRVLRRRRRRATPAREPAKSQPPDSRPAASETASTEPAASQPTETRQPHRDP